ncbi:hypothetical protein [Defluviimonas salinarum]|uniref:Uncharacterized protein n=1 Tax=Defluviimonas salinarum TaxID=2992147 RepID=A0ABT3J4D0_9RHOB|nr:hypothetical protein [Defluviimonas salinarum]MCW3782516.1 hypothetical protein [Defluviimonas salinarum]
MLFKGKTENTFRKPETEEARTGANAALVPSDAYLRNRAEELRDRFGVTRGGGWPILVAIDIAITDQDRLETFRDEAAQLPDPGAGIDVRRALTLEKGQMAKNMALVGLLACPERGLAEYGISGSVQVLVSPLSDHIRAGNARPRGLAGPGSDAIRVEILAEIDRPEMLLAGAIRDRDGRQPPVASLEAGLAGVLLLGRIAPETGMKVLGITEATRTPVTDHLRARAARMVLAEKPRAVREPERDCGYEMAM